MCKNGIMKYCTFLRVCAFISMYVCACLCEWVCVCMCVSECVYVISCGFGFGWLTVCV